jgi:CheY-like chemotaxis protein
MIHHQAGIVVLTLKKIGTSVTVNLPLSRAPSKGSSSRSSSGLYEAPSDPTLLPPRSGLSVLFVGFDYQSNKKPSSFGEYDAQVRLALKSAALNCMVDWLGMTPVNNPADVTSADYVVILLDANLSDVAWPYILDISQKSVRVIAILGSGTTRRDAELSFGQAIKAFEVVSPPFGPRSMATAVAACEKAASGSPSSLVSSMVRQGGPTARSQLPLPLRRKLSGVRTVYDTQDLISRSELVGLRTAVSPMVDSRIAAAAPIRRQSPPHSRDELSVLSPGDPLSHPTPDPRSAHSSINRPTQRNVLPANQVTLHASAPTPLQDSPASVRLPHLLLVDDNKINLRLLETFMKRRKYTYECAENGLFAVEAVRRRTAGYDVIFMDLSMPVMDGLEATRAIRDIERKRCDELGEKSAPNPALIIALTGLANRRDQARAFANGIDLFITKPVKFAELGRLLDRWTEGEGLGMRDEAIV